VYWRILQKSYWETQAGKLQQIAMTTTTPIPVIGGYRLDKFTSASFGKTKASWEAQLAANKGAVFKSEYLMILNYCSNCLDYAGNNGNSYTYGIFKGNNDEADALIELVYQKDGRKWLKLLNLHLCPTVDVSFQTQDIDISQVSAIFGAALAGTVYLTSTDHPTKVTKLYGRSGTLLSFLKGIGAYIQANVPAISVSVEGRWLVIRS
jgi:hypothetical protein